MATKRNVGEKGKSAVVKPSPFGVELKPVGRNLTLDRGANSVVTTSSKFKSEPESVAQISKLKPVFLTEKERSQKTPVTSDTKLPSTRTGLNSVKLSSSPLNSRKLSDISSKPERKSSPPSRTMVSNSTSAKKPITTNFDPLTGEIVLDSARVSDFLSKTQSIDKTSTDPPWNVQLKSVPKTKSMEKIQSPSSTKSPKKSSEFSFDLSTVQEKDNSRQRPDRQTRVKSVPPDYLSQSRRDKSSLGGERIKSTKTATSAALKSTKTTAKTVKATDKSSKGRDSKEKQILNSSVKGGKSLVNNDKRSSAKPETDSSEVKVSPRGRFVTKLIEKCESRDEYKDGSGKEEESSDDNLEFPDALLEKLASLEGLVSGSSSDESEDEGYDDVAAVIECLAEEDFGKKKRRFAFKNKNLFSSKDKNPTRRQSAPPLGSLDLQQMEEENIYNSPEEVCVPDWDTGSSQIGDSESTSNDSVMNNVNVQPHTVIELSDKQAKKLKKQKPGETAANAKWKKKWQKFYRRSQDLLDIPGLQVKLENLSIGQLPANVKQKLRERIKKKRLKKSGHLEINPVIVDVDDEYDNDSHMSSSSDLRSDFTEDEIYQTIEGVKADSLPVLNVNLRVSSANSEKIPISPPLNEGETDSVPDLPPRSHAGSIYEKYSELGPKAPSNSPPLLPPKSQWIRLDSKRASLPTQALSGSLEVAPPLPPRNTRLSLGSLDVKVPPPSEALAESYLKKPKLADRFPSESSPRKLTAEEENPLLAKIPAPFSPHRGSRKEGYLDMTNGECNSPDSSPERSLPAPFTNVMEFKQQTTDHKNTMDDIDIDLELQLTVKRSRYKSRFEYEPLYQYYNKDYVERQSWQRTLSEERGNVDDTTLETHEVITPEVNITISAENRTNGSQSNLFSSVSPNGSMHRSLWSEVPEVISSGVLETLTPEEKKEQEAMFEIITSEASYFKSLNVLINVFVMSAEFCGEVSDRAVVTKRSKHLLFSNIGAVRDASERFLADLEARWNEGVLISDISDVIIKHASQHFDPYVKYCTNKTFQDRAFIDLLKASPAFKEAVVRLQSTPEVQGLTMDSFFLLPMQRITRLPLLMDGVCRHRDPHSPKHKAAVQALDTINKLVKKCNEGAKVLEQTEQLLNIEKQLDFKIRKVPIVSSSRHLVKQGELTRVITDSNSKLPFNKNRPSKQAVYLFLFNDLLLVTKKKGENQFSVIDSSPRNSLHCESITNVDSFPLLPHGAPSGCKNLFLMAILENHEEKQTEIILSANSPSDRARWMEAVTPKMQISENERIYEEWDCPQVQALHHYKATQPDELDLEESDVVNVFRKMADGWFEGERIRDGERGWFPESYVEEILSSHVRARNLRLRYRLLIASKELATKKS